MILRKLTRRLALAVVVAVAAPALGGCKNVPTIPGTEIPDTDENREILQVLERYRTAMVRQDRAAILSTAPGVRSTGSADARQLLAAQHVDGTGPLRGGQG